MSRIDEEVAAVQERLDALLDAVEEEAQEAIAPFQKEAERIRNSKRRTTEWFKYFPHVYLQEKGDGTTRLHIVWREVKWVPDPENPGRNKLLSNHVRKNRDGQYTIGSFRKAGPEEKAWIQSTLQDMEKPMATMRLVGSIRKSIANTMRKYRK